MRNSGNATSRQRSKGLNINCAELFSPPVLLPGTASQVQGSRRSPVECSVSITGTSHGAVTREAATHPLSTAPGAADLLWPHKHTHIGPYEEKYTNTYTHLPLSLWGRAGVTFRVTDTDAEMRPCVLFLGRVISPKCLSVKDLSKRSWEHDTQSFEIPQQRFSRLSKLCSFAITAQVFCKSCQVLTWGDNCSPDELSTPALTPAVFEACRGVCLRRTLWLSPTGCPPYLGTVRAGCKWVSREINHPD